MRYWWNMNKFGGEVISVTPEEATRGMEAKTSGEIFNLARLGLMAIDPKSIIDFEKTGRIIVSVDRPMLEAGVESETGRPMGEVALPSNHGGVLAQWVKKFVTERVFARDHAGRPGYYALRKAEDQGGLFVVCTRPMFASGLPEGLEELEDWEKAIMERRLASTPGWHNS